MKRAIGKMVGFFVNATVFRCLLSQYRAEFGDNKNKDALEVLKEIVINHVNKSPLGPAAGVQELEDFDRAFHAFNTDHDRQSLSSWIRSFGK